MRVHVISICPLTKAQKERLEHRGKLVYYDAELTDPNLVDKCRGADVLVTTPRLNIDIISFLDNCQLISVQGTGTDAINIQAATAKSIVVCNVPTFSADAVAEHAFALMLAVTRKLFLGKDVLLNSTWKSGLAYEVGGIYGTTLGIFGFGKIGARVSAIGHGFGMRIIANTKHPSPERAARHKVSFVDFEDLLSQSDFIVLAAPVTGETRGLFGRAQFVRMKRSAVLVNVSRGMLVDETALAEALRDGLLRGAAQDVFVVEPPPSNYALLQLSNFVATPHVAWGTREAVQTLLDVAISNVEAFLDGHPQHVVNPEAIVHDAARLSSKHGFA